MGKPEREASIKHVSMILELMFEKQISERVNLCNVNQSNMNILKLPEITERKCDRATQNILGGTSTGQDDIQVSEYNASTVRDIASRGMWEYF